jgi:hypothetical protein
MEHDLGQAASRNPDMLPPRNVFERVLTKLYDATAALSRGNCLFALKGAVLTGPFLFMVPRRVRTDG